MTARGRPRARRAGGHRASRRRAHAPGGGRGPRRRRRARGRAPGRRGRRAAVGRGLARGGRWLGAGRAARASRCPGVRGRPSWRTPAARCGSLVRTADGRDRVTLVRQPDFSEPEDPAECCLLLDDVVLAGDALRLVRVAEPGGIADAVHVIDLDGDGTDELLATYFLAPLNDASTSTEARVFRWADGRFAPPTRDRAAGRLGQHALRPRRQRRRSRRRGGRHQQRGAQLPVPAEPRSRGHAWWSRTPGSSSTRRWRCRSASGVAGWRSSDPASALPSSRGRAPSPPASPTAALPIDERAADRRRRGRRRAAAARAPRRHRRAPRAHPARPGAAGRADRSGRARRPPRWPAVRSSRTPGRCPVGVRTAGPAAIVAGRLLPAPRLDDAAARDGRARRWRSRSASSAATARGSPSTTARCGSAAIDPAGGRLDPPVVNPSAVVTIAPLTAAATPEANGGVHEPSVEGGIALGDGVTGVSARRPGRRGPRATWLTGLPARSGSARRGGAERGGRRWRARRRRRAAPGRDGRARRAG